MRILLAGLWSRRALNAATFLLAILAVAVAMVGPLYARASVEHLLDARIAERPAATLGLTASVPAMPPGSPPVGSPERYEPPDPDALLRQPTQTVSNEAVEKHWEDPKRYLLDMGTFPRGSLDLETGVYWQEGMCEDASIEGQCPTAPGEALMDAEMADTLELSEGDTFELAFTESWQSKERVSGSAALVFQSRRTPREFTIVGTYEIGNPDDPVWFQPARFQGDGLLRPPTGQNPTTPTAPALLVDKASMTSQTFVAGADRPIDPNQVNLDTIDATARALTVYRDQYISDETAPDFESIDLESLFAEVRSEQTLLSRVTLAAAVPLVVLALLLLHMLVSAAADARRSQVALAKLRGFSPRRVFWFAVSEPFLIVLAATPAAVLTAYVGARLLVRTWLGGGPPVVVTPLALGAAGVVALTAMVTATVAVVGVVQEPLAASLASTTRKQVTSRLALVARSAVVMLAIAALVQVWSSRGTDSTTVLELLAPLFVGLALAVAGIVLLGLTARWWVSRTSTRGGVATYLSSRRVLRRRDMVRLMMPLLLSVSVTVFAVSAWQVADDWRVSKAKATVGASTTYLTTTDPGRLMRVTHEVDPEGRYLATAVLATERAEGIGRMLLVDIPRFARVAAWDHGWSDQSVARAQRRLLPPSSGGDPIRFSGRNLSLTLRDVSLQAELHRPLELWVRYTRGDTGSQSTALLGEMPGPGDGRIRGFVSGCDEPCRLEQVFLSGGSASITDASGRFTIASAEIDGKTLDWRLTQSDAWRPARPFPLSLVDPPVALRADDDGLTVDVSLGRGDGSDAAAASGIARITPTDIAEIPPMLVTSTTNVNPTEAPLTPGGLTYPGRVVTASSLLGVETPMREVGRVRALPAVGDEGAVSDLGVALREHGELASSVSSTQLWVAESTPASVVDEVRDAGVTLTNVRTVSGELEILRSDAFSLGWKVFLLVGALTVLLAILGVLAGAVTQTRWRAYEVAALRVVGVRRRDLVRASVLEYAAILGFAVLFGAASAVVALKVVLPSIDIGDVGEFDPFVDYAIRWTVLGGVVAVVLGAVLLIAVVISVRTAGLGRPSTVRQNERA